MKKFTLALLSLILIVGLGSCGKKNLEEICKDVTEANASQKAKDLSQDDFKILLDYSNDAMNKLVEGIRKEGLNFDAEKLKKNYPYLDQASLLISAADKEGLLNDENEKAFTKLSDKFNEALKASIGAFNAASPQIDVSDIENPDFDDADFEIESEN